MDTSTFQLRNNNPSLISAEDAKDIPMNLNADLMERTTIIFASLEDAPEKSEELTEDHVFKFAKDFQKIQSVPCLDYSTETHVLLDKTDNTLFQETNADHQIVHAKVFMNQFAVLMELHITVLVTLKNVLK